MENSTNRKVATNLVSVPPQSPTRVHQYTRTTDIRLLLSRFIVLGAIIMFFDLYDITGKLVFRFSTNIGMGINTISIPLDELKGGVYFYSVILNAEILKSDKIIITR